jgi:hypothetical protein
MTAHELHTSGWFTAATPVAICPSFDIAPKTSARPPRADRSLLVEPTAATRRVPRHSTLHGGQRACFTYAQLTSSTRLVEPADTKCPMPFIFQKD